MYNFKTLRCTYCDSVITNLPDIIIDRLDGLTFQCEGCNHSNVLIGAQLYKCREDDTTSIFSLIDESLIA